VGFYDDTTGNDFVNFQAWLYEATNNIEMYYGPSSIQSIADIFSPATGPDVGIITNLNLVTQTFSGILLQGNPASPTAVTLNNASNIVTLTGVPADGKMYRFSTGATGIAERNELSALGFYPNPVADALQITGMDVLQGKPLQVNILDLSGRKVFSSTLSETQSALDLSKLPRGFYMIEFINGSSYISSKIIKE
ncbi:MAG: T9SS type A sorting domain-containing protein, partial [Hymenobacteraceae bacterium]|nr:T9SS type A sorting domain-containing protein [Hymenobacteraceae bacterium]MDX5395205.1 T9SS type A sorting domain-containing protein [Hymenobacteraceae bacterium]MDX5443736.1 T9SS type A sorting domain-containing protein [Hymenobacteraceae bacterium]MDX5511243.1 T9SS type A sorting domain-containing protein [Hymenobacteraceae bacterium]